MNPTGPRAVQGIVVSIGISLYDLTMQSYSLKISSNGQVSIPAAVRRRWGAARVLVIDKGDRVIVRPLPEDRLGAVIGKYARTTPPSEVLREIARAEDAEHDR